MTTIENRCPCGEWIKDDQELCQSCATKKAILEYTESVEQWKEDRRDGGYL